MFGNGDRSLSLFALMGDPAHLVSIEFFIKPNPDDTSTGIADGNHMLVRSYLAKFFLRLVTPGNGGQQAGVSPPAFPVGKEFRMGFA